MLKGKGEGGLYLEGIALVLVGEEIDAGEDDGVEEVCAVTVYVVAI